MSTADVIHDVSLLLQNLLKTVGSQVTVTVDSPQRVTSQGPLLNLFLYLVGVDDSRRNTGWVALSEKSGRPKEKRANPEIFAPEPLALKLFYLVTAFAVDGLAEQRLLGHAIQIFHENQHLSTKDLPERTAARLKAEQMDLVLLDLDIDAMQKIWGQGKESLRASVAYEVAGIYLESGVPRQAPLVESVNDEARPLRPGES